MTDIKLAVKIDADVYTRLFDNGIQDNEIATDDICEMARALRLGKPYEERKTGKWIGEYKKVTIDEYGNTTGSCYCSVCGEWLTSSDEYPTRGRYCPNCGTKMEVDNGEL